MEWKKTGLFLLLLSIPFALLYFMLYFYLISTSPLTRDEMDRDGNGRISFFEADYAGSFDTREFEKDGEKCIEYRSQEDGVVMKVRCGK